MKYYEDVKITEYVRKKLTKTECDLCKSVIGKSKIYKIDRVEISHTIGLAYPEVGGGSKIQVDICPSCFVNKITPWLKSEGAEFTEEKWEW